MKLDKENIKELLTNKNKLNESNNQYKWDISKVNICFINDSILDTKPYLLLHSGSSLNESNTLYINKNIDTSSLDEVSNEIYNELKHLDNKSNLKPTFSSIEESITYNLSDGSTPEHIMKLLELHAQPYNDNTKNWVDIARRISKNVATKFKKLDKNEFKEYDNKQLMLDEGLIDIPQKAYSYCESFVNYFILSMAWHTIYTEDDKNHIKSFLEKLNINYQETLKEKNILDSNNRINFNFDKGIYGRFAIKLNKGELPYNKDIESNVSIMLVTNQKESLGFAINNESTPTLGINFFKIHKLLSQLEDKPELLYNKNFIEKVDYIKRDLLNTITHELMHIVQYTVLSKNNSKILSRGEDDNTVDDHEKYLLSPVEYDPMISDVVNEFNYLIQTMSNYIGNISEDVKRELLKKYVGSSELENKVPEKLKNHMYSSIIEETFRPKEFILLLKKKDPKKWKLAIRKIFSEVF